MKTPRMLLAIASLSLCGIGHAGSLNTTMSVNANVIPGCTSLSATALNFGNFSLPPVGPVTGTATITVTCGASVAYTVDINAGLNPIGGPSVRLLVTALYPTDTSKLVYDLYKDVARTQLWGTAVSGTALASSGTGGPQTHTVYGQVSNFVNASTVGAYSDTVTVTLSF